MLGTVTAPKVFVIGGTHGDEMPGISTVKSIRAIAQRAPLSVEAIYGNAPAIVARRRYIDLDMNRISRSVADFKFDAQDAIRIKELYDRYSFSRTRVGIDLHTTESNTGVMPIIVRNSQFDYNINLAKAVKRGTDKPVRVLAPLLPTSGEPENLIPNICERHLGIEIGPVKHGEQDYSVAREMLGAVLSVNEHVSAGASEIADPIEVYTPVGAIIAKEGFSVKGDFVGEDFKALSPDTVVMSGRGEDVKAKDAISISLIGKLERGDLYPVFIGEPVYLTEEVKKVCVLCTKEEM